MLHLYLVVMENEQLRNRLNIHHSLEVHSATAYFISYPEKTEVDFFKYLKDKGVELPNRNQVDYFFRKYKLDKSKYDAIWAGERNFLTQIELTNFYKNLEATQTHLKKNGSRFIGSDFSKLNKFFKNEIVFDRIKFIKERKNYKFRDYPPRRHTGECKLTDVNYRFRVGLIYLQLYKDLLDSGVHLEDLPFATVNKRILEPFRDILRALAPYPFKPKKLKDFITNSF